LCGWDVDRTTQELERYRGMLEKVTPTPTVVSS
jgi:hypothetical protein